MSVGGVDIVLSAPSHPGVADLILRACRRHWSGETCFFQDAQVEHEIHSLEEPWVWARGTTSKEFFLYKNAEAAQSWEKDGPTRANVNTMLHFIIGKPLSEVRFLTDVALVCDRVSPDIRCLVEDLKTSFSSLIEGGLVREAA